MKLYCFIFTLFLGIFPHHSIYAQTTSSSVNNEDGKKYKKKNILKEVKNYYKSSNYIKTDEIIQNAFKSYKEASDDPDLLAYEMNAHYQLYLDENKKLFLNQKGDTIKFFNHIYKTYVYALKCDSVCSVPNHDGQLNKRYTSDINNRLSLLRNNLRNGGMYYIKKKKYNEALAFFRLYINTIYHPFVLKNTESTSSDNDKRIYLMALHAAYGAGEYKDVLTFMPEAIKNEDRTEVILEMSAQSAMQVGDTVLGVKLMNNGFDKFPDNEYFKANLIKYYHDHKNLTQTIRILDRCIQTDSAAPKYWKLKGNEYYDIDSLDLASNAYKHVIEIDKEDVDVLGKLANIYMRKASEFYDSANLKIGAPYYEKNRKILSSYYESAMVYYEILRSLKPDNPSLWKEGLRETYYKLNKGNELKKLEKKD